MGDLEQFTVPLGNDGLFAIMFFNRNRYPESKLKEDFGKFGEIINLRILEKNNTCFVRYQEHFEAANCLKEMSLNPSYVAKIPENKNSRQRSFHERFNKSGRFSHGKNDSDSGDKFKSQAYDTPVNENRTIEKPNNTRLSHNGNNGSNSNVDEPPPLVNYNETVSRNYFSPPKSDTDRLPELKPFVNVLWERELSELPTVIATEVIIANLPPGVYQPELYELCAEAEPLEINIYFTGRQVQVYYASVFVRTLKHAHLLIAKLNGIFLERNELMVELASKILKEHIASSDSAKESI